MSVHVARAGWSLPKEHQGRFPDEGQHLVRYARRIPAVEVNSSFYKHHMPRTWAKWAGMVPSAFRFAPKAPREATHEHRLSATEDLSDFLAEVGELGDKLGPLLLQLPPSLTLDPDRTEAFLEDLRKRHDGPVVIEPRHESWLGSEADRLLRHHGVGLVAADADRFPTASEPGGDRTLMYHRLHGRPRMYYGSYDADELDRLAEQLTTEAAEAEQVWCVFNNTAGQAAMDNLFALLDRLDEDLLPG